ncbi:MAG: hypothetical protein EXQ70_02555 [Solirubrobacterales bacterium]|nr:hypothetical protein [Solirubrobacterales bacterium]
MAKAKPGTESGNDGSRAEASIQAFRDALEKSVTISRERLQEVIEDAVRRGRMTRGDGEELAGRMLSRGRTRVDDILGDLEQALTQLRGDVGATAKETRKRAVGAVDQPLAQADRVRRKAGIGGFPISAYDQLNARQINSRLTELSPQELRRVRDYEQGSRARKGVLYAVERKLEASG